MESLISLITGAVLALIFVKYRNKNATSVSTQTFSTIEKLHAVGELTVFRANTKEIITASDHYFGNFGQKYFRWLISNKKMAIIFHFDIDFKYDLHSKNFIIKESNEALEITMPPYIYSTYLKDIKFYDEQGSRLLPWLLPNLINDVFGDSFNQVSKNRLIDEAKKQVETIAQEIASNMEGVIQNSAKQTLRTIVQGMSDKKISIYFLDGQPNPTSISYEVDNENKMIA
ncbi:MAG TPA: DUF4230 domain-containing protein [Epsilonproteobacteria bacterium]|nr:DUF4230 domain-containing protein [Campylobacterota bacterium]